ncbi:glycosyltransferase family 2 protein [Bradyrhizobium frederickii]|uniref:Glycosyltransferase family 2 protein n=1 Tax=Bradyrhizobium frederickii TaxID=2560054 RepID=A0A4Y9P4S4_9BRAD|nr:glycosyltransferase family 2 protein [Bradyrhizobium frederickii]TFV73713.1 glycosyltransferase family 2 protein [Bradyrhizobium frederickii]
MSKDSAQLSVIICNYNYAQFVGSAIRSALAIDWPRVEVIVVDDGSTDDSPEIIKQFAEDGVKVLLRPNRGQARAAEEGFLCSSGDWIIFLDSDDLLDSSIVQEGIKVMTPGWSMIQFQMRVIDNGGIAVGNCFPKYLASATPEQIRSWASETDCYPTPPTSGNLLSREFLRKLFPLNAGFDRAVDSYFLSTAPFLGDVISISKPLVSYRVHGANDGAQTHLDLSRIRRDLARHLARCEYATKVAFEHGVPLNPSRWRYGFYNLAMRIASLRLGRDQHPLAEDSVARCLADGMRSLARAQGLSAGRQIGMFLWLISVALLPSSIARNLVSWRFAPLSRPRWLQKFIQSA